MKLKMHPAYLFLIGVLLISIVVVGYYIDKDSKDKMNFGGIEISSGDLNYLTEPIGEGRFLICDIKNNKCAVSYKYQVEK